MSQPHFYGNCCISSGLRMRSRRQPFQLGLRTTRQRRGRMSCEDSRGLLSNNNYQGDELSRLHFIVSLKNLQGLPMPPRILEESCTGWLHRGDFVYPVAAMIINSVQRSQLKRRSVHKGQHLGKESLTGFIFPDEIGTYHFL